MYLFQIVDSVLSQDDDSEDDDPNLVDMSIGG